MVKILNVSLKHALSVWHGSASVMERGRAPYFSAHDECRGNCGRLKELAPRLTAIETGLGYFA